jgi:hypothetical protein
LARLNFDKQWPGTRLRGREIRLVFGLDRTDSSAGQTSVTRLNRAGGANGGEDLQASRSRVRHSSS